MIWKIIVGIGVIVSLITGIVKYDDRLAKCEDVDKSLESLEIKVVQTLDQFQNNMRYQQYDYLQDNYTRDYYNCILKQKENPQNLNISNECNEIKKELEIIKNKKSNIIN